MSPRAATVSGTLDPLGVELPIVQAGMGGGLACHELAAAVSDAGGLGTIGILAPAALRAELEAARKLTAKPIAVNLIVPLARRAHWRVAASADVCVTHWDARPKRRTPGTWIHTAGSVEEALAGHAAGADGVIVQGIESGGHVRGTIPAMELLERVLAGVPSGFPVLLAGGIASREDAAAALDAGAHAAVSGTLFLASEESRAHPKYKRRLVESERTFVTDLFGLAWPSAPHRVLANDATRRWLRADGTTPGWVRAAHAALTPLARAALPVVERRLTARAASGVLDLSPAAPIDSMDAATIETHPLYAGATVSRLHAIRPAADIVAALTPG